MIKQNNTTTREINLQQRTNTMDLQPSGSQQEAREARDAREESVIQDDQIGEAGDVPQYSSGQPEEREDVGVQLRASRYDGYHYVQCQQCNKATRNKF